MGVLMGDRASWELSAGDEIAQDRSVMRLLGGGRRYEAYLVWDERMLAPMVAKLIRPDQAEDASALRALQREADALAALAHPVILRGFDAVLDPPHPHVLVEHLEGRRCGSCSSRGDRCRRNGTDAGGTSPPLSTTWREGWLHLDLKPGNIRWAPRRASSTCRCADRETAGRVREPIGTNAYMSPEQCADGDLSPAADIWGRGHALSRPGRPAPVPEARRRGALLQLHEEVRRWPAGVPGGLSKRSSPACDRIRRSGRRPPSCSTASGSVAYAAGFSMTAASPWPTPMHIVAMP